MSALQAEFPYEDNRETHVLEQRSGEGYPRPGGGVSPSRMMPGDTAQFMQGRLSVEKERAKSRRPSWLPTWRAGGARKEC